MDYSDMNEKLKIKKQLLENEKISYATDTIELPKGGIDCSEGCNPYGFPPECAKAVKNFDVSRLGPYPHSQALYNAIIEYWKDQCFVERENILITDGSISALYVINNMFDTHDSVVLGISPQFTDYYMHAEMLGIDYAPYQLKKKHNYKFDRYEFMEMHYIANTYAGAALPGKTYNFIYVDNPNNPTGQCIDIEDIEKIIKGALKKNITVIIDEAYGDFMPKENSAVQLCEKYPNLVVVRTLSKGYGLAGLRVGYIIACKELIHCMNKMVNPYMVGELSREVAAEALKHEDFIEKCKGDFAEMKAEIRETLNPSIIRKRKKGDEEIIIKIPGPDSGRLHMAETLDTNSLLLLYHDDKNINLRDEFFKRGVLVIDGYDFKGLDSTAARVRLPKKDEFPKLIKAIAEINKL